MLFGSNQYADVLLEILKLTRSQVGRFRDAWASEDGKEIYIYTRNGGGNRDHWESSGAEDGPECNCPGCIITHQLPQHPHYAGDKDDGFDCTYATIHFHTPPGFVNIVAAIQDQSPGVNPTERFARLIANLQSGEDNTETQRAMAIGARLLEALKTTETKQEIATPDGAITIEKP